MDVGILVHSGDLLAERHGRLLVAGAHVLKHLFVERLDDRAQRRCPRRRVGLPDVEVKDTNSHEERCCDDRQAPRQAAVDVHVLQ